MALIIQKIIILIIAFGVNEGMFEIIKAPRDTETVVGQMTFVNCSISDPSKGVTWLYYPVGSADWVLIYFTGSVAENYKNRVTIERHPYPGGFNLVIQSVQASDAGKYVCQEEGENGQLRSAELVVLAARNNFLTAEKKEGEEASCLLNGSPPCTYRWIRSENGRDDLASDNQNTTFSQPGLYRCEADCTIRKKHCVLVAGQVKVATAAHLEPKLLFPMSVIFLVIGCTAIVLSAGILLYTRKKFCHHTHKADSALALEDNEASSLLRSASVNWRMLIMGNSFPFSRIRSRNINAYDSKAFNSNNQWRMENFNNPARIELDKNGVHICICDNSDPNHINEIYRVNSSGKLPKTWSTGIFCTELD